MFGCSLSTKVAVLVVSGVALSLTGLLCYLFVPILIQQSVKQRLILSPNSDTYDEWRKISIPIYTKYYIFNITNPDAILNSNEPPIVEELGPYTFRESREKINITWNHLNGTVSYMQVRKWHFISEKTNGSLDDSVIHLNVPLVTAADEISKTADNSAGINFLYNSLNALIEDFNSTLFVKHTIRELLFDGYDDELLETGSNFYSLKNITKFGWFYERNNTSTDGVFRIFTGENGNINKLGLMNTWNHLNMSDHWFGQQCERFDKSSAGDFQPPFVEPPANNIHIFVSDICRSLSLEYQRDVEFKGINSHRYWASHSTFDYSLYENKCYCYENRCPANGALNISRCASGSPAAISFPHFLYADSIYTNNIKGLHPDPKKHSFYMDIENTLGMAVNVEVRLQVNIVVNKNENLQHLDQLKHQIYFPQFWFSVSAQINDEMVDKVYFLTETLPLIIIAFSFALVLIGGLILIFASFYAYKYRRIGSLKHRQKYEAVDVISTSFIN